MRVLAEAIGQEFVAQGEQARRLQADDGDTPAHIGEQCIDCAPRFLARLVDHTRGEESAAAA